MLACLFAFQQQRRVKLLSRSERITPLSNIACLVTDPLERIGFELSEKNVRSELMLGDVIGLNARSGRSDQSRH